MQFPANFALILLTVMVYVGRHWIPELEPIQAVLLLMIRPDQPTLPYRSAEPPVAGQ